MITERTWKIADIDGRNERQITLAEFNAMHEKHKALAAVIMAAVKRGGLAGVGKAQAAMRAKFNGIGG